MIGLFNSCYDIIFSEVFMAKSKSRKKAVEKKKTIKKSMEAMKDPAYLKALDNLLSLSKDTNEQKEPE
jgi:hypothetical protein